MPVLPQRPGGHWIEAAAGMAGLGAFRCRCRRIWYSGLAQHTFRQQCVRCWWWCRPGWFWRQTEKNKREDSAKKPHLARRCEACRAGQCTRSQKDYF